jgi:uncharacterized protein YndB with AHSA1/START domain
VSPPAAAGTTLQLKRTFDAPREDVFRAWTDPERLRQWLTPPGGVAPRAEVDLREGGHYRIEMQLMGDTGYVGGDYLEVQPPERLVFTWAWEPVEVEEANTPETRAVAPLMNDTGDTRVSVEFREQGSSTEVVLTHEALRTDAVRQFHEGGWTNSLDQLEKVL